MTCGGTTSYGLCKKQEYFLCCLAIVTWLPGQRTSRRVQVCPETKRKSWWCQSYRWFKTSVRDHTRAQMAFIVIYGTLLIELVMIYNLRYCRLKLVVYGWWDSHVNFLGPYKEHWTLNKLIVAISLYIKKTTTMIRITWSLFFVCSSCLFTFSLSRAHTYHAMHNLPVSIICPFPQKSLQTFYM